MRTLIIRLFLLLGLFFSTLASAAYTDNGDGTVTDTTTGLTWMRCSMGQAWNGSTCTGTASTYTWNQAMALTNTFGGQNDWRLPNVRELQTIVDRSRFNPAIDTTVFPNTSSSHFWSGSPFAGLSGFAWYVGFSYGNAGNFERSNSYGVRLVRGGQSLALLSDTRPDADYTDNSDGTVTHKPTGLMWKRCSEGQTGSSCTGTATTYIWDQAKALTANFAGNSDWRIPTEEELISLVDYTKTSPTINPTLFPGTPVSVFWSGSPFASGSSHAWGVSFVYGYGSYNFRSGYLGVRLVRGGQSFGSLAPPGAPASATATAGNAQAMVSFTAPTSNGGTAITGYTATCGSFTGTGTVSPITVTGLTNGTAYTCSVTATNSAGTGAASAVSNSVTPSNSSQTIGAISFNPATLAVGGTTTASAIGGASGNAVTFTSTTTGICTAIGTNGSTVTGISAGTCTIAANQAGNANYSAATQITRSITVTAASTPANLVTGWNLLGNSNATSIDVATTFGDPNKITTVWKWNKIASKWAFYAPSMTSTALSTYAQNKGYDVLTSIAPKEGFWVNASAVVTLSNPAASGVMLAESDLQPGWNLAGSADNKTPSQLNQGLSSSLSSAGKLITTAWAWDAPNKNWKFFAPSLEASGGLANYITTKGYLPFNAALSASDGFWLNIGATSSPVASGVPTVTGMSTSTGAAGSSVTITGTNFSATPASNTVTFGGTAATVTAATATSLTVTVPSGATSGTVSVTTAGGAATSAGSFTVSSVGGNSAGGTLTFSSPVKLVWGDQFNGTSTDIDVASLSFPLPISDTMGALTNLGGGNGYGSLMPNIPSGYPMNGTKLDFGTQVRLGGTNLSYIFFDTAMGPDFYNDPVRLTPFANGKTGPCFVSGINYANDPTCASMGITFNSAAGTLTFSSTQLYASHTLVLKNTVSGTVYFPPY